LNNYLAIRRNGKNNNSSSNNIGSFKKDSSINNTINKNTNNSENNKGIISHYLSSSLSSSSSSSSSVAIGVFLVPNNDDVSTKTPLSQVLVRLDQLEAILGYTIFPDHDHDHMHNSSSNSNITSSTTSTSIMNMNDIIMKYLDPLVPSTQDLIITLDSKYLNTQPNYLIDTNNHIQLKSDDYHDVKQNNIIIKNRPLSTFDIKKSKGNNNNSTSSYSSVLLSSYNHDSHSMIHQSINIKHLCECIDCNMPLFGK
jgi:hypothetical protein